MAFKMFKTLPRQYLNDLFNRDQYVKILWDNIIDEWRFSYDLFVGSHTYGVAYDGLSVMHYESTFFANGDEPTMTSLVYNFVLIIDKHFSGHLYIFYTET